MKTIGLAGLGLIGGSMLKAIKAHGAASAVYGFDTDPSVMEQAQPFIDGALTEETLPACDIVIVALYPTAVMDYVKNHLHLFKKSAIVVDCAGVKANICNEISPLAHAQGVRFVGGHPMAGIERSGFENATEGLFQNASMILCLDPFTDHEALHELEAFFFAIGFGSVKITSAADHDRVIAYTSQLAHIVSNAYIKSETARNHTGMSAGSYKDLTRVAKLNETMWTELFFENRENLLIETNRLLHALYLYKQALETGDAERMKGLLKEGRLLKEMGV